VTTGARLVAGGTGGTGGIGSVIVRLLAERGPREGGFVTGQKLDVDGGHSV
jgi:hypothetical protein